MLYRELIEKNLESGSMVVSDNIQSYSYCQLHNQAAKAAAVLEKYDLKAGDRVIVINDNKINTVIMILAALFLGVCFVLVPDEISKEQLNYIVDDARADLIIGEKIIVKREKAMTFSEFYEESSKMFPSVRTAQKLQNKLVYILYTSGSTGKPKGVIASEKQVLFCTDAINERLQNGENDKILCCLPLSFDYGLYQMFLALKFGAYLILVHKPIIQQIPQLLWKEKITAFPAMPALLNMLRKTGLLERTELPKLRYITSTGDYFPVELVEYLMDLLPKTSIIPMYGLTECKRVSVMPIGNVQKVLAGSCGLPLSGVQVYLENQDENGVGELIVSGMNVMEGYWNDEKVTKQYFYQDAQRGKCLRTGDLFKIDNEGYLYFCGRKKRILKVNGYRIGNQELEEKLEKALSEQVIEQRVLGIPDDLCGERIVICIYTEKEEDKIVGILRKEVKNWPVYQKPQGVYFSKMDFPKSINQKIDEELLRKEILKYGYIAL